MGVTIYFALVQMLPRPECMQVKTIVAIPCPAAMQGSFMLCSYIMKEISIKSRYDR